MKKIIQIFIFLTSVLYAAEAASVSGGPALAGPAVAERDISIDKDLIPFIETQFSEFASFTKVNQPITQENNGPLYTWLEKQTLTSKNRQTLVFLALGMNPKTGIQSGYISIKAIDLLRAVLRSGVIKNTLDWMHDLLTNPEAQFTQWQKRSELAEVYREFPLLSIEVLKHIQTKCPAAQTTISMLERNISQQLERLKSNIVARSLEGDFKERLCRYGNLEIHKDLIFCLYHAQMMTVPLYALSTAAIVRLGNARSCFMLGVEIEKGRSHRNLRGKQITTSVERLKAAEECYREAIKGAQEPEAYHSLGFLIEKGPANQDLRGKSITTDEERGEAAAECYREGIKRKPLAKSYNNLGGLIDTGQTKKDLRGQPITASTQAEAAAECYREGFKLEQLPDIYHNFGLLIAKTHIQRDLNGKPFSKEQKYEIAAKYFRIAIARGQMPKAYYFLGSLIAEGLIQNDLNDIPIPDNQRYQVAARYFRIATQREKMDDAYYNLGVLVFKECIATDENDNPVTDRFATTHRLFELAGPKWAERLARLYLLHDFGLTREQRLTKIESILNGKHPEIMAIGHLQLAEDSGCLIETFWNMLITNGCNLEYLTLLPNNSTEDGEDSSAEDREDFSIAADAIQDRFREAEKALPTINPMSILLSQENSLRTALQENQETLFSTLFRRYAVKMRKLKAAFEERQEKIKRFAQPKITDSSKEKLTVRFTQTAYEHFQGLNKTGRTRLQTLLEAIESEDTTGHEEALTGQVEFEGRPIMTRELGRDDRLAYVQKKNTIIILSLRGHFNTRSLKLGSNRETIDLTDSVAAQDYTSGRAAAADAGEGNAAQALCDDSSAFDS